MIILGIDPGTATTGYGIVSKERGKLALKECGCIKTGKALPQPERLLLIRKELNKIIKKHKPQMVAVEELFFFKNLKTAIKVAEARGVILATASEAKVAISEYTPLEVKIAISGYGRAEKSQVQKMVKAILGLKEIVEPDDAADAVAIAICAANSLNIK